MMLVLAGEGADQASADAKRILDLETKLAASQLTRVEQRVPENTYHPTAVTDSLRWRPRSIGPPTSRTSASLRRR